MTMPSASGTKVFVVLHGEFLKFFGVYSSREIAEKRFDEYRSVERGLGEPTIVEEIVDSEGAAIIPDARMTTARRAKRP